MDDKSLYHRYQRQIILPGFGLEGQLRLSKAKILVVGAGGLGCAALPYLAAAGVGTLGIIDDDTVALHNLQRQVLYTMADLGLSKAETASRKLRQLNPEINLPVFNERLTNQSAFSIFPSFDLILDGTDNFATRYLINDACLLLNKPLVFGAISQFEGQLAVFNARQNENDKGIHYRDVFPHPPKQNEVPNCAEAGVLGVLPGIVGTMMANEALKYFTGLGSLLAGKMLRYDAHTGQSYVMDILPDAEGRSLVPKDKTAFLKTDYIQLCSDAMWDESEIDVDRFNALLNTGEWVVVDVRESGEEPELNEFPHLRIPFSKLIRETDLSLYDKLILFCQSGSRSLQAAKQLSGIFESSKTIYSLRGGIMQWKKNWKAK